LSPCAKVPHKIYFSPSYVILFRFSDGFGWLVSYHFVLNFLRQILPFLCSPVCPPASGRLQVTGIGHHTQLVLVLVLILLFWYWEGKFTWSVCLVNLCTSPFGSNCSQVSLDKYWGLLILWTCYAASPDFYFKRLRFSWVPVAYACNPSYLGGLDQQDHHLGK
jgi:hypothetical protein